MPEKKRTSDINAIFGDAKTLQEMFDLVKKGTEKNAEYEKALKKKADKDRADNQKRIIRELIEFENSLGEISDTTKAKLEKRALEKQAKEDKQKRQEAYKEALKNDKKLKAEERKENYKNNKATVKYLKQQQKELKDEGKELTAEQKKDLKEAQADIRAVNISNFWGGVLNSVGKTFSSLLSSLNKITSTIDSQITTYTQYQAGINARLQGTNLNRGINLKGQDYFGVITQYLESSVGTSPYFKTENLLNNLQSLVESGVASNVEQRAFLQTIKDDIATTFDAANSSLLRIVRLQQSDSTAMRLGMEAYLTRFLNELVSNTEYLSTTFDNVQDALLEASSLMSMGASTELEYTVQKWLGTLTGVGLSEQSATSLAQALGYLGSGNISGLESSNMQGLLAMAANRAGLSYASLLNQGLTSDTANVLIGSLVNYMNELSATGSSNVVRSQLAQAFGLNISDLVAASSIDASTWQAVSGSRLSSTGMYRELASQLNSLSGRLPVATMIDNLFSNMSFDIASNIAGDVTNAVTWKIASLLEEAVGGIPIPTVSIMGSSVDLNTSVAQLMKLGMVGWNTIGMLDDLFVGINSWNNASSLLANLGIGANTAATVRGTGISGSTSGFDTSYSSYYNYIGGSAQEGTNYLVDQAKEDAKVQMGTEEVTNYTKDLYDIVSTTIVDYLSDLVTSVDNIERKIDLA